MMENQGRENILAEELQGQFALQKIYIKELSFKAQSSPVLFQEKWHPTLNMDLSNGAAFIGDGLFDVVLTVSVSVSVRYKTMYLAEVHQAGVFLIKNIDDEIKKRILGTTCANILFPFAREAVSDLVVRAGFPQLLLQPVNFEILYLQQKEKGSEKAAARIAYSMPRC